MISNFINRLRTPIPISDRILEIVTGIMLIALLVLTAILYKISPDTIPTHYSISGTPDALSNKSFYWQISGLFVLFILLDFISAYYTDKKIVRLPVRRKNMTPRQMMLAGRMCRIINIGLVLMWLSTLLSISVPVLGLNKMVITILNASALLVLIIPSIWYGIKIARC